jgi:hypothetical protein
METALSLVRRAMEREGCSRIHLRLQRDTCDSGEPGDGWVNENHVTQLVEAVTRNCGFESRHDSFGGSSLFRRNIRTPGQGLSVRPAGVEKMIER